MKDIRMSAIQSLSIACMAPGATGAQEGPSVTWPQHRLLQTAQLLQELLGRTGMGSPSPPPPPLPCILVTAMNLFPNAQQTEEKDFNILPEAALRPWHLDRLIHKHSTISMCTPYAWDPSTTALQCPLTLQLSKRRKLWRSSWRIICLIIQEQWKKALLCTGGFGGAGEITFSQQSPAAWFTYKARSWFQSQPFKLMAIRKASHLLVQPVLMINLNIWLVYKVYILTGLYFICHFS